MSVYLKEQELLPFLTDCFLAGKDLFLSGTRMCGLAFRTAVEQGHGAVSSFTVFPWLAGLLLRAPTAVACAESSGG